MTTRRSSSSAYSRSWSMESDQNLGGGGEGYSPRDWNTIRRKSRQREIISTLIWHVQADDVRIIVFTSPRLLCISSLISCYCIFFYSSMSRYNSYSARNPSTSGTTPLCCVIRDFTICDSRHCSTRPLPL